MSLDTDTVRNIAFLARIEVPEEKLAPLAGELNAIIGWVEQLAEVNTDGIDPMTSVVEMEMPAREDVVSDGNCRDKVLANAPDREDVYFTVPKVIE